MQGRDDAENYGEELELRHKRLLIQGKRVLYYREISSTNRIAGRIAAKGGSEGTIVACAHQSSGSGRLGRGWLCPSGTAITMSLLLRPKLATDSIPLLTLLCGVAVADAASSFVGGVGIKWPNDVLAGGRKLCGILAQSGVSKKGGLYVVMGVGLNVNQTPGQLPENCRDIATSLRIEAGGRLSRLEALKAFIGAWDERYAAFQDEGPAYLRREWLKRDVTLGRRIRITDGAAGHVEGVARDISGRGGVIVELADGSTREYMAEDLSLGRPFYDDTLVTSDERNPRR